MRAQLSTTPRWCIIGSALMCNKCFQLPVHLIRHPLLPQLAELPTLRRGRPKQVILIRVTASRRHTELISPKQEPGQGTHGTFWLPSGCFIRDTPAPLVWPQRRARWRRCHPPTQHIPAPQSFCTSGLDSNCFPPIWNHTRCLSKMLSFTNLKLEVKN